MLTVTELSESSRPASWPKKTNKNLSEDTGSRTRKLTGNLEKHCFPFCLEIVKQLSYEASSLQSTGEAYDSNETNHHIVPKLAMGIFT